MAVPTGAQAFQGESVVLTPDGTDLTGPAKTIITNPTFLDEFEDAAPASQKQGLLRTLMGSRALPMIGKLLGPIGVGFAAFEICNAVFDGCISFSDSGDSGYTKGEWVWTNRPKTSNGATSSAMIFTENGIAYTYVGMASQEAKNKGCGERPLPDGITGWGSPGSRNVSCAGTLFTLPANFAQRWPETWKVHYGSLPGASTGLGVSKYCRGWGAADECQNGPDTAGWSKQAAIGVKSESPPEVGQWVASQIEGSNVPNPYVTKVSVPDCDGLVWATCEDLLEELGLEAVREPLDWQGAHVDKAAGAVLQLQPASGSEVEPPVKVTVTTNPDEAGMPLLVPAPQPGETYEQYISKLAPGLNPQRVDLPDSSLDPTVGPNGVVRTYPQPGTRLNPQTEHQVDVQTNPPTAPTPSTTPWSAPPVSSIDLSPLAGISIGCNDFPFGIFCWIGDGLSGANASEACPSIGVPMGSSVGLDDELAFDLCMFEPAMLVVRPVLVLLSAFSLAFMFAAAAMGFGGGSNED